MDNNTVQNTEVQVPKGMDMTDTDYLNDMLSTAKSLNSGYAIVLNEASNEYLFNEISELCKETHECSRKLFNLLFAKGWYKLEQADNNKVTTLINEYEQKINELT